MIVIVLKIDTHIILNIFIFCFDFLRSSHTPLLNRAWFYLASIKFYLLGS